MPKPAKPSAERVVQSGAISEPRGVCIVPHIEGKLIFFYEWCKKCGICVLICPSGALTELEDKTPVLAEPDKCKFCSLCWRICPDFAILRNPNWEEQQNAT